MRICLRLLYCASLSASCHRGMKSKCLVLSGIISANLNQLSMYGLMSKQLFLIVRLIAIGLEMDLSRLSIIRKVRYGAQ